MRLDWLEKEKKKNYSYFLIKQRLAEQQDEEDETLETRWYEMKRKGHECFVFG